MADTKENSVSVEDANKALLIAMKMQPPDAEPAPEPEVQPEKEPVTEEPKPAEQVDETPAVAEPEPGTTEAPAAPTDDVESLKASLAAKEEELAAIREKANRSIQWGRDGFLRKSQELEGYKKAIERFRKGEQMTVEELDRLIGQPPAGSAAQQPPWPGGAPQQAPPDELAMQDADAFAIEHGLHGKRGDDFEAFLRDAGKNMTADQLQRLRTLNSIPGNTYAVLNFAHTVWQQKAAAQTKAQVAAVRTVQKVQKETMRAAGTVAGRARPAPPAEKAPDFSKMTAEERLKGGHVDRWLQEVLQR